jgi:hypothetical protein
MERGVVMKHFREMHPWDFIVTAGFTILLFAALWATVLVIFAFRNGGFPG